MKKNVWWRWHSLRSAILLKPGQFHDSMESAVEYEGGRAMKIIFLDIDGVLQPFENEDRFNHDLNETVELIKKRYNNDIYGKMDPYDVCAVYYDWDINAVRLLKECIQETGAEIAVSSGWRDFNDEERMRALFRIHGLDKYITAVLPKGRKEEAIKWYLKKNAAEIESYVVVDDYDMSSIFGTQMIRTRDRLTEENVQEIRNALRSDL